MSIADLDPRTPVLVGVGQSSERIDAPGYRGMSAVELAAAAAREALVDAGADPGALAAAVDTVAGVRQFEITTPGASAPPRIRCGATGQSHTPASPPTTREKARTGDR